LEAKLYMTRMAKTACFSRSVSGLLVFALSLGSWYLADSHSAAALPAFAAQTGLLCAACHEGFPELTPLGRRFKLDGYVMGGSYPLAKNIAAMLQGGYTQLHAKVPGGLAPDYPSNNAWSLQQTSLFYGGAIDANIGLGAFVQGTFDGVAHEFSWDNTDVRLAQHAVLGGKPLTYGFTFNNAPSVTDLWNTLPSWGYPFISSGLAVGPTAEIQISALAQAVAGVGGYADYNLTPLDTVYVETDFYKALPNHTAFALGVGPEAPVDGAIPYWRMAIEHDWGGNSLEFGTSGLSDHPFPDGSTHGPTDAFLDLGVDSQYQFISTTQAASVMASYYHESQHYGASFSQGLTQNLNNSLNTVTITGNYLWNQALGISESYNDITGSGDNVLYSAAPISGNANGKPNTQSFTTELDYYPFNRGGPKAFPWVNVKFFAMETIYPQFNGLAENYDGNGRSAQDNDVFFTGAWLAF
jgi:hypothetical protein